MVDSGTWGPALRADVESWTLEARWKFPRGGPEAKGNRLDYEEGKENELAWQ
jgi:hypothetical protein